MAGEHYYISDLHLAPHTRGVNALFDYFIANFAQGAASLTINGDLFNSYYGFKQLKRSFYRDICRQLRGLVGSGTRVDFVGGNRDFLFVKDAPRYGMRGYLDEVYRQLPKDRVAAIHGDGFCLDDRGHQRMRKVLRVLPLRGMNYIVPGFVGAVVAGTLRGVSRLKGKHRTEYADIKDEPVIEFIRRQGCDTAVCGHIHRPQERRYMLRGRDVRMLVLGDWKEDGAVIARATASEPLTLMQLTFDGIE
ncbi:MAG: UDP-2,3-diacylglucosamine diphosphatase, partial [Planctomycetes bacterium]|nr:UDP-2,3-diacylglucosamine diphosphatase [Planctomycetota bacterium]